MKKNLLTLALLGGAVVVAQARRQSPTGSSGAADVDYRNQAGLPRGQRNNNPGNIKINVNNNWLGKVPVSANTDRTFEQFTSYKYGIRAMLVLLKNYLEQGHNTIQKIIYRYAPPSVDPSASYVGFVVANTGIPANTLLTFNASTFRKILMAMTAFENGRQVVTAAQVDAVWTEFFASVAGNSCRHTVCGICGGYNPRQGINGLEDFCSAKCLAASKDKCTCKCGGKYHRGNNLNELNRLLNRSVAGIVDEAPPGLQQCRDGKYSTFPRGARGGVCSYHGGPVMSRARAKAAAPAPDIDPLPIAPMMIPAAQVQVQVPDYKLPTMLPALPAPAMVPALPAQAPVEAPEEDLPENYWIINADRKAELHLDYNFYKNLPADDRDYIKRFFLFSRPKSAWVSKGFSASYPVDYIVKKLNLPLAGKEDRRSFAEQMERKQENAAQRIIRLENAIDRSKQKQEALMSEFRRLKKDWAWLTQPNINTRSGRAFTKQREKVYNRYEKGTQEWKRQEELQRRIDASEGTANAVKMRDIGYLTRKIEEAKKRIIGNTKGIEEFNTALETGVTILGDTVTDETRERMLEWIDKMVENIEYEQGKYAYYKEKLDNLVETSGVTIWDKNSLADALYIKRGTGRSESWHKVLRVNPTTVTHSWFVGTWKTPFSEIKDAVFPGDKFTISRKSLEGSFFITKDVVSGFLHRIFPGIGAIFPTKKYML